MEHILAVSWLVKKIRSLCKDNKIFISNNILASSIMCYQNPTHLVYPTRKFPGIKTHYEDELFHNKNEKRKESRQYKKKLSNNKKPVLIPIWIVLGWWLYIRTLWHEFLNLEYISTCKISKGNSVENSENSQSIF